MKRQRRRNMKDYKMVLIYMAMLTAIVMVATLAVAQELTADNMQIFFEKICADKKLIVSQNMQLTDSEAKAFWPVYQQYQDELFLLRTRTAKMIKDYHDAYNSLTDDNAKKLLDEYMTIETLALKLRQDYLPKFRKVLPQVKVVRYYQIENKIQAALMYELAGEIPLAKTPKQ
ncbi:conserved exported hypothetical protein [uncultured Desulfobacterium sp.]|uniref:Uncharacterized protein n=1 Tax=uncultured Desulfobacterium sp. TaxID=201089 RepID=A0A445N1N1_9BACT|nr:conserved exported hypothetical protein [uncultured Desulfobacterium sp.]